MSKPVLLIASLITMLTVSGQKYVQVRDEPRHHNVFENEFVRILDVHLGPNDTTGYHLHYTPSVFIRLSNSNTGSQLLGGPNLEGANISGTISFDSIAQPRIHRVWNKDTNWFHVIDAELVTKKKPIQLPALKNAELKILFTEELVNGYELDLKGFNAVSLPASARGYLLVSLDAGEATIKINDAVQQRSLKQGHYNWVDAGKKIYLLNKKASEVRFVLLQFK
jgi:hypothetical protein